MYNLICIVGPTASGKTTLAVNIACRMGAEIISADSRQVYRGMDIGTGKDLGEYTVNGKTIPCHLLDIVDAGYKYNIFEYQRDFFKVWEDMQRRGALPVMCGGSGLYVESVLKGYRLTAVPVNETLRGELEGKCLEELSNRLSMYKELHNTTDVDTVKRAVRAIEIEEYYMTHPKEEHSLPELSPLIIGVDVDRELRRARITQRLYQRLNDGMIEEVKGLLDSGILADDLIYYGLEYKFITQYLTGKLTKKKMIEQLNIAIHQFAKRQMTWFRKMEKEGFVIHWLDARKRVEENVEEIVRLYKMD